MGSAVVSTFPCKAENLRVGYHVSIGHLRSALLVKGVSSWMAVGLVYCDVKSRDVHIRLVAPGGKRLVLRVPPEQYFRTEKMDAPRPAG